MQAHPILSTWHILGAVLMVAVCLAWLIWYDRHIQSEDEHDTVLWLETEQEMHREEARRAA